MNQTNLEPLPSYQKVKNPKTEAETLINNGIEECLNQNYEEGIADFNHVLRLDPNGKIAAYNKGIALIRRGSERVSAGRSDILTGLNIIKERGHRFKEIKEFLEARLSFLQRLE